MSQPAAQVAVGYEPPASREQAAELAARLELPLFEHGDVSPPFLLTLTGERLELRQSGPQAPGPVYVDFAGPAAEYRRKHGGGHGQTIARAVGIKGGKRPLVLDATAGLGRDGFVLATLGCRVLLFERSPVVFALLEDGIHRGLTDETIAPIIQRLSLMHGDTRELLARMQETPPEVIYLDPMYPHRSKSALVKKEMRLLRVLVGDDEDAAELLDLALQHASDRVVVKRPKTAPPIPGPTPSLTVAGKNSRYDIYLTKKC